MYNICFVIMKQKWAQIKGTPLIITRKETRILIILSKYHLKSIHPSMTAKVKISQNVDILAKVYLVHLSQTLSNLTCTKYIYRLKWVDNFWLVKALSNIVQNGQNDSKNQSKCPCVHILVNSQSRLLATKVQLIVGGLNGNGTKHIPSWYVVIFREQIFQKFKSEIDYHLMIHFHIMTLQWIEIIWIHFHSFLK